MRTVTVVLTCLGLAPLVGCTDSPSDPGPPREVAVLYIGNTLISAHRLPDFVQAMADSVGAPMDWWGLVGASWFTLEDQWEAQGPLEAIRTGDYQVVILQEGPPPQGSAFDALEPWVERFAEEIRTAGGEPALMTPWMPVQRWDELPELLTAYGEVSERTGVPLIPVGELWLDAFREDPTLPLFSGDLLHPSVDGTWAMALMTVARLTGSPPSSIPRRIRLPGVGTTVVEVNIVTARRLREATDRLLSEAGHPAPLLPRP